MRPDREPDPLGWLWLIVIVVVALWALYEIGKGFSA
jgi:hypothetical protein